MSRLENSDWILLFKWNEKSTQFFVGFNPYKSRKWTFYLKNVDVRKEMLTLADDSIQPICFIIGGWSKEKFNQITLYGTNLRFRRGFSMFSLNNLRDLVFIRDGCLYTSIHDDYGLLFYHHKKKCTIVNKLHRKWPKRLTFLWRVGTTPDYQRLDDCSHSRHTLWLQFLWCRQFLKMFWNSFYHRLYT